MQCLPVCWENWIQPLLILRTSVSFSGRQAQTVCPLSWLKILLKFKVCTNMVCIWCQHSFLNDIGLGTSLEFDPICCIWPNVRLQCAVLIFNVVKGWFSIYTLLLYWAVHILEQCQTIVSQRESIQWVRVALREIPPWCQRLRVRGQNGQTGHWP